MFCQRTITNFGNNWIKCPSFLNKILCPNAEYWKKKLKEHIWRRHDPSPFPFFLLSVSMEHFPLDKIFLLYTYSNCAFFPTSPFSVYFIEGKDLSNKNYFDVNETRSSGFFLADIEQKPEERVLAVSW